MSAVTVTLSVAARERRESFVRSIRQLCQQATPGNRGNHLSTRSTIWVIAFLALSACGESPLADIGRRSSDWVNEPTALTTTTVPVTVPVVSAADELIWFNDDLGSPIDADPELVVEQVFARREGDRFIQASRAEIAIALGGIAFPTQIPPLVEYVTSQLVIENSGVVSDNPSAAFGLWTAEPYTRSRSVAQSVVLRVSLDASAAEEIRNEDADVSCGRFIDTTTDSCEVEDNEGRPLWVLKSNAGTTMIWFQGNYRYEMFGRPFVAVEALRQSAASMAPLEDTLIGPA